MFVPLFRVGGLGRWSALAVVGLWGVAGLRAQDIGLGSYPTPPLGSGQGLDFKADMTIPIPDTSTTGTPATGTYVPARAIKHPSPGYPLLASLNRIQGVVRIRFAVDDTGHVTRVYTSQSSGSIMLDSLATDPILREWVFQPATLDGKPIASAVEKEFEFKLDPKEQRAIAAHRLALPIGQPNPPYPPEALALQPRPSGHCTISVTWSNRGLVDSIFLASDAPSATPSPAPSTAPNASQTPTPAPTRQGTGSNVLDLAALNFAYNNWRIDPKDIKRDKDGKVIPFTKVVIFTAP